MIMDEAWETSDTDQDWTCASCSVRLEAPWVRCAVCVPVLDICPSCFCYGVELRQHESDHAYSVIKFSFPLYEASWTAAEEIRLLEAVQEYGLGNWAAVGARIRTKSAEDCERHYFKCYVDNPEYPLPEFPDPTHNTRAAPVVFKLSDNPPRPVEGSTLWSEMGEYSAARSDFSEEYDNFIEYEICEISASDHQTASEHESNGDDEENTFGEESAKDRNLFQDLKLAVIDVYRNCLMERQRRKRVVHDYGLINIKKTQVAFKRRYDNFLSIDFLRPFMRLFPPMTFDKYLESLLYEKKLRADIGCLLEYRRNGITKLHMAKHFHMMRQRRENMRGQRHLLTDVLNHVQDELSCQAWLAKQASDGKSKAPVLPPLAAPRKAAPRLNIEGLPGYERLNEHEREFCAEVRLVPQAYLDFSHILIVENAKTGSLRLAQARTLIKIDVNKTRKLFDFLVHHGRITKGS